MKTCKVTPDPGQCIMCGDTYELLGGGYKMPDCKNCSQNTDRYNLIGFSGGLFGRYAIVEKDGELRDVKISSIYDVRDGGK